VQLSVRELLDSVSNKHTRKEYRYGIKKFYEWFGKRPEEILEMRKDDLTPRPDENIVEGKHRAKRFEREIEQFHAHLVEQGYAINTARTSTLGIRQLFRYYEMPVQMRTGSKISKTVKTSKSFPLRIEHVRAMFNVADLRERVLLALATDLALRISDFRNIKKTDLPELSQEPPIPFAVMTNKENAVAHGFLSAETVKLLKVYLKTIEDVDNQYLFPSNGKKAISEDRINSWLRKLAEKAKISTRGKRLSFHCFRKMFLSASIDSGIGLTAGKKMCGKAIPKSDDTYLTTVQLRKKFIQLKTMLKIRHALKPENKERLAKLETAITQLQKENVSNKTIAEVMTKRVAELESILKETANQNEDLQPLLEFVDSFKSQDELQTFLDLLKTSSIIRFPEQKMTLVLDVPLKTGETLKKLERKNGKRIFVTEILQEIWEKFSEQTLRIVLEQLERKTH
jgi:integrase